MESITQETNKEQNQQVFDEETRRKIQATLQKLDNKQQQQQQNSSNSLVGGKRFVKFMYDGEHKRLSFTGQHSEEHVPYKDFKTKEIVEGKFSERYYFECHDITDPNHLSLSIWERGSREARTILFWFSKNKNVLDVTRRGQPGSMTTTYDIYPAMD